jgi:cytochrome c oxidase assembly factor CtaG
VSGRSPQVRSSSGLQAFRTVLAVLGLVLWLFFLVPPLSSWAHRYEYVQAIQFCVFAVLTPALLVMGAPWRWLRLASGEPHTFDHDGQLVTPRQPRLVDRFALSRAARPGHRRAVILVCVFSVVAIFWRLAPIGDDLARHGWLAIVESLSLVSVGVALWMDLVESPPLSPGATRPYRIGMATASMWVVWVFAYLFAQSHDSWYAAFHHVAGRGVSLSADQQLSAAFLWLLTAGAFLPVIFWNLVHWLQAEEDPDDELYHLVRRQKTFGYDVSK